MGYELSKGDFFITMGDSTTLLGNGIPFTEEVELSADECPPHIYHLNTPSEINLSICSFDLSLMNDLCSTQFNDKFTIEYHTPIMIQARWHKNPRIRKKWLKRFGMKPDTVKVKTDATALEYTPGHILDEQYDNSGMCAAYNSMEFRTDKHEYVLRPDQKRKGICIEW